MIRARAGGRDAAARARFAAAAMLAAAMLAAAMLAAVPARAQAPESPDLFAPPSMPDARFLPSPEGSPSPSESPSPPPEAAPDAPTLGRTLPETPAEAAGTWDLSLAGTTRRCMLTFATESGANGRPVRFPAGCRRALPLLGTVVGWLFAGDGLRLVDRNVRPLLQFAARPDGRSLTGRSEAGETYNLVPLQIGAMAPKASDPAAGDAAAQASASPGGGGIPGSQPGLPPDALRPATAAGGSRQGTSSPGTPPPGLYSLDRFTEKDVCRIELDPLPAGPTPEKALAPARLLPGCRDSGITVFDPDAWRFAGGLMTLKSRRGHAVNLVAAGDGVWRRDPDVGTTFVLRRVER